MKEGSHYLIFQQFVEDFCGCCANSRKMVSLNFLVFYMVAAADDRVL